MPKLCLYCDFELPEKESNVGRPSKYCDSACRAAAQYLRRRKARNKERLAELIAMTPDEVRRNEEAQIAEYNERLDKKLERILNNYRRPGRPRGSKNKPKTQL